MARLRQPYQRQTQDIVRNPLSGWTVAPIETAPSCVTGGVGDVVAPQVRAPPMPIFLRQQRVFDMTVTTRAESQLSWIVPPIVVPLLLGAMILAAALYRANL